jgi:hypothetical protein
MVDSPAASLLVREDSSTLPSVLSSMATAPMADDN